MRDSLVDAEDMTGDGKPQAENKEQPKRNGFANGNPEPRREQPERSAAAFNKERNETNK